MVPNPRTTCRFILLAINIAIATSQLGPPENIVLPGRIITPAAKCTDNALVFNRYCLHYREPSIWAAAYKMCTRLGSNISLVETMQTLEERQDMYELLRKRSASAVWIPIGNTYKKKLQDNGKTSFNSSWPIGKTSVHYECMALVTSMEHKQLSLQMEDCSRHLPFFCVTTILDAKRSENKTNKALVSVFANQPSCNGTVRKASHKSSMEFRIEAMNTVYLDVYNPEMLLNFSFFEPFVLVKNPKCVLEGASLNSSHKPQTEFQENTTWPQMSGQLSYSITKAVFKIIFEGQGYLSCVARTAGCESDVATNRLLVRIPNEHTFSLAIHFNSSHCEDTDCDPNRNKTFLAQVGNSLRRDFSETYRISPVRITNRTQNSIIVIFHVMLHSDAALNREVEMASDQTMTQEIFEIVDWHVQFGRTPGLDAVLHVRSTAFCHRDEDSGTLHWPATELGDVALSDKLCAGADGIPVTRKCLGDFIEGAHWADVNQSVCEETSSRSQLLHQLAMESATLVRSDAQDTLYKLNSALNLEQEAHDRQLAPIEIQSIAVTLANLQATKLNASDIPKIANVTNAVIMMSRDEINGSIDSLRIAQDNMNCSNSILESLDHLLYDVNLAKNEELVVTETFAVLVVDIPNSMCGKDLPSMGLRGLAVLKNSMDLYDGRRNYFRPEVSAAQFDDNLTPSVDPQDIVPLSWSDTIDSVLKMNLSAAAILPDALVLGQRSKTDTPAGKYQGAGCGGSGSSLPRRLVISAFWDDSLFGTSLASKHVLSVAVDGRRQELDDPLVLLFDRPYDVVTQIDSQGGIQQPCVFWDFNGNGRRGRWHNTGCSLATIKDDSPPSVAATVDICVCTHLTHFGELIPFSSSDSNFGHSIIQASNTKVLDMISLIGCSLSLLGLLGVFLTAALFPEWRRGTGKKIQLHLSGASFILITTFLHVAVFGNPQRASETAAELRCVAVGFLLNYSVLSSFLWMLTMAWYQYQRLTRPLESLNHTPHYLLFSGVVAWGLPIVPCCTLVATSSYQPPSCYPQGAASFSITVPVGVIIVMNIVIFILILWSIFGCRRCMIQFQADCQLRNNQCERQRVVRRLVASVYLFSLLGLCWLFGYLQWSLLFSLTAPLQGLSFFVFFVVLDETTRGKWSRYLQRNHIKVTSAVGNSHSSEDFVKRWSAKRKSRLSARVSAFVEEK